MNRPIPIIDSSIPIIKIDNAIAAGFPVPHTDSSNSQIDLNDQLLINKNSSFLFRVRGDSMTGVGIYDGDSIIVDRSIEPLHNHIVLAVVDGEFTVKRLYRRGAVVKLIPENERFEPILFEAGHELQIWGVVSCCIRQLL